MTGLVLKLKPFEKLLVNGVILQNGDKAARLRIRTAGASVLRLRDALHPKKAVTSTQKAYYVAQLAVAGLVDKSAASDEILSMLNGQSPNANPNIDAAREAARACKFFSVMRSLRKIIPREILGGAFDDGESAACSHRQSR